MAANITLIDFIKLSSYRGKLEEYFKLILCIDTNHEEEFVEKDLSTYNLIEYHDWQVVDFDIEHGRTAIYIKQS